MKKDIDVSEIGAFVIELKKLEVHLKYLKNEQDSMGRIISQIGRRLNNDSVEELIESQNMIQIRTNYRKSHTPFREHLKDYPDQNKIIEFLENIEKTHKRILYLKGELKEADLEF